MTKTEKFLIENRPEIYNKPQKPIPPMNIDEFRSELLTALNRIADSLQSIDDTLQNDVIKVSGNILVDGHIDADVND
ncbi:MAG: hypothetical protein LKJ45_05300 [Oscillospiraceae bacterium]|jgi:hypothetical protein|nr:hypothetical protein [Oscillospiraceae bacterium]